MENERMETTSEITEETENTGFIIDSDEKAEWALRKIKERETEFERLKALGLSDIERVSRLIEEEKARCDADTAFFRGALDVYMDSVKCRITKAGTMKYRLLSGTLVRKKGGTNFVKNDDVLADYLMRSGRTDLIKTKISPIWSEFKKQCSVVDGKVIDTETGEIVEGVVAEVAPNAFKIEWEDDK